MLAWKRYQADGNRLQTRPSTRRPTLLAEIDDRREGPMKYRPNPKGRAKRPMRICVGLMFKSHPDKGVRDLARVQVDGDGTGPGCHDLNEVLANPEGNPRTARQRAWDRRCKKPEMGAWQIDSINRTIPDADRHWKSKPRVR